MLKAAEALQLVQSSWWGLFRDGLNFKAINGDTLLGNKESQ